MPTKKHDDAAMIDLDEENREARTEHIADDSASLASAAVLIGVTALIEPELIAGLALGAGFVLASKWAPDLLGGVLKPMAKSAVKIGYAAAARASEIAAEASEQMQDMMAEARAEAKQESENHARTQ